MPDQRLSLRTDAGSSAEPYVDGALLAIRKVHTLTGVHREDWMPFSICRGFSESIDSRLDG